MNQIVHGDDVVHVQPKVMRVLLHLAACEGEVAGREELIRDVWADIFVTDDVLKRCISDLRKALGDDHQTPRFIQTIPKVGYRLLTTVEPIEPHHPAPQPDAPAAPSAGPVPHPARRWWPAAAATVVIFGGAAAWWLRPHDLPAPHVVQLSSEQLVSPGTFSPDGKQIVFASPGDTGDNWDIWLRMVGQAETRRLTTNAATDEWPAWSPDGKQIAFLRFEPSGAAAVHLISPVGGTERRLLDFPARGPAPSWSPDGRWLAAARAGEPNNLFGTGIYVLPTAGGEPRQVTYPTPSAFDAAPAFSPDGSTLAYINCEGAHPGYACDVWTLAIDAEGQPRHEPRRLTRDGFFLGPLAWTRDGSSIIYAAGSARSSRLWRVRTDGSAAPSRVELAGLGAVTPSTIACCDQLAYVRNLENADVYRYEAGTGARPLFASTAFDFNPQYSPDGNRIAFSSGRADERDEVWLANADGSGVTRLTRGPGRWQGSPRWSPNGLTIAFDSMAANGHWDIWTIGADGSSLRQLTQDAADENMPSWSRDGRFVYYGSNRTGRYEIWRITIATGKEDQLTNAGGYLPFESLDGGTLYYLRTRGGQLLARPTAGGDERSIAPCVDTWAYAVAPKGLFLVDCLASENGAKPSHVLRFWDAETGEFRRLDTLDTASGMIMGLSASPDGRRLLYGRYTSTTDLMMIENFR